MIQMDTRNILFVCGGAFEGLDKVISQRVGKRTMGFGADGDDEHDSDTPDVLPLVQPEDLLAYGMIPEFVGRVPVITTMDELVENDLLRILTEPHDAIIKQSQRLFAMDGVEVEFTEEALRQIVSLTVHKGTGARGLRSVLEQAMMDIMFDIPSQEGVTRLQVTGDMIERGIEQYSSEDEEMQAQTRLISKPRRCAFPRSNSKFGAVRTADLPKDGLPENRLSGALQRRQVLADQQVGAAQEAGAHQYRTRLRPSS